MATLNESKPRFPARRRCTQTELDEAARPAGFGEREPRIDPAGWFAVTLAEKPR